MSARQKAKKHKARQVASKPKATPEVSPTEYPEIIGLLSWYDEDPAWLSASVASLSKLGVNHLVAVDGSYLLLPDGKPASPPEQREAIAETAHGLGIGLTLHVPPTKWAGNETEKRSALFALGEMVARPHDWYFVLDADEVVKECPVDLRKRLAETDLDSGQTMLLNRSAPTSEQARQFDWDPVTRVPIPKLFRAIPGLRVKGSHYCYLTPDGRDLWGHGYEVQQRGGNAFLDATDLLIEHRSAYRGKHRSEQQRAYYERRDRLKAEHHPCGKCGDKATKTVAIEPEKLPNEEISAWVVPVCDDCYPALREKADAWCRANDVPRDYFERAKPKGENA